jgi:hypothetical protein
MYLIVDVYSSLSLRGYGSTWLFAIIHPLASCMPLESNEKGMALEQAAHLVMQPTVKKPIM